MASALRWKSAMAARCWETRAAAWAKSASVRVPRSSPVSTMSRSCEAYSMAVETASYACRRWARALVPDEAMTPGRSMSVRMTLE